jgi:hypothetical protein
MRLVQLAVSTQWHYLFSIIYWWTYLQKKKKWSDIYGTENTVLAWNNVCIGLAVRLTMC